MCKRCRVTVHPRDVLLLGYSAVRSTLSPLHGGCSATLQQCNKTTAQQILLSYSAGVAVEPSEDEATRWLSRYAHGMDDRVSKGDNSQIRYCSYQVSMAWRWPGISRTSALWHGVREHQQIAQLLSVSSRSAFIRRLSFGFRENNQRLTLRT
jgi:hypothetical protein